MSDFRDILSCVKNAVDTPQTIEEIASATGSRVNTVSTTLSRMLQENEYPNLRRVSRGVYIWDSIPRQQVTEEDFIGTKIKYLSETKMLISIDDELWVMTKLDI